MTTLIISNEEIKDILTIFKFLEESGLLTKDVRETFENEVKEQNGGFLGMSVGALPTSLFGKLLAGKP